MKVCTIYSLLCTVSGLLHAFVKEINANSAQGLKLVQSTGRMPHVRGRAPTAISLSACTQLTTAAQQQGMFLADDQ